MEDEAVLGRVALGLERAEERLLRAWFGSGSGLRIGVKGLRVKVRVRARTGVGVRVRARARARVRDKVGSAGSVEAVQVRGRPYSTCRSARVPASASASSAEGRLPVRTPG